ncbi:LamG domain-containing protein [Allostreptomyces psammosilenae]|uniref:LamG-like jellyroll fold domain-containing protein n=1 Tax=Allostreptomyces psammosilenae TaxID=1892865 RepID=A0A852ZLU5_9ACTN|nr:LamG domain-containing protein [Allostreptomyces psammosilenae]NYI03376.1 hypothetical protein [Allostreptomyces psammosilenae]
MGEVSLRATVRGLAAAVLGGVLVLPMAPGAAASVSDPVGGAGAGSGIDLAAVPPRQDSVPPTPSRTFPLDGTAGSTQIDSFGATYSAALHGGAQLGGEGVLGTGLHLDGVDDYAQAPGPFLDTSGSFSVSLWARLPEEPVDGVVVALAQGGTEGQTNAGFQIQYDSELGGWVFRRTTAPGADGQQVRAVQPVCPPEDTTCQDARLGEWTHIVGVSNAVSRQNRLYVNGELVSKVPFLTPWDARGPLHIGADWSAGEATNHFPGDLDEIGVYDYALSGAAIGELHAHRPVLDGHPVKAHWPLDEPSFLTSLTGRGATVTAPLSGDAVLFTPGVIRGALRLDGSGDWASAGRPVVNTANSFSVSLWARIPEERQAGELTALSQGGANRSGFQLYHSAELGGWVFLRGDADTTEAGDTRAAQRACPAGTADCAQAGLGEWTHVVGVYDRAAAVMRLYVDGSVVDEVPATSPAWSSSGEFRLGDVLVGSNRSGDFQGDLDDIQLFDRALTGLEAETLFAHRPRVTTHLPLNVATGTPAFTPDITGRGNDAVLHGDATFGRGYVGRGNAIVLDGDGDYASTESAPIDTTKSFSVSMWVTAPERPQQRAAVLSMPGEHDSAFTVRYVPHDTVPLDAGRWQLELGDEDAPEPDPTPTVVQHTNYQRNYRWNHLAVVYDAVAGQIRLFVDGSLMQVVCEDDDPADCTEWASWRAGVSSFAAQGGLQLGRTLTDGVWGEYWTGSIDDVWTFQGILPDSAVRQLANSGRDENSNTP